MNRLLLTWLAAFVLHFVVALAMVLLDVESHPWFTGDAVGLHFGLWAVFAWLVSAD